MRKINISLISSLIATTSILVAAPVPNIDDALRSVNPPSNIKKENKPLVEIDGIKKYAPMMVDDKSGKKTFINGFKFTGVNSLKIEELNNLLKNYENKELDFSQLTELASIITKYYRSKGFFVARAYIPVQSIKNNNNIFEISIIEGNYNKFQLENKSSVQNDYIQNVLDNTKNRSKVITNNSLERTVLLVNETAGILLSAVEVIPGDEVGTSDFLVKTDKSSFYNGYLIADNQGSIYTGKNRIMSGVTVNSPANYGDELSFSGLITNDSNLKNGNVGYMFPLGYDGLTGRFNFANTLYNLNKIQGNYNGESKIFDFILSYPIIKLKEESLYVKSILSSKKMKDYQENDITTDKAVKVLNLKLEHIKQINMLGFDGVINSNLNLGLGKLQFNDIDSQDIDLRGAKTEGNYEKIEGNTNLSMQIDNNFILSNNFAFQQALGNKNLDGSEDFSLGGINGVKVYPDGEFSAENGLMWNVELFRKLPEINFISHKVSVFYDVATATMQDSSFDAEFRRRTLQDTGFGYQMNYKDFFAKSYVAWKLGADDVISEPSYNSRVLFQTGLVF
jgi:hemolysin activation/secretion protein